MPLAPSIKDTLQADLASACSDLPSALVWWNGTVAGTAGVPEASRDLDEEGAIVAVDLEWVGPRGAFAGKIPGVGDIVTVEGTRYAVSTAIDDGAALTLGLRRGP